MFDVAEERFANKRVGLEPTDASVVVSASPTISIDSFGAANGCASNCVSDNSPGSAAMDAGITVARGRTGFVVLTLFVLLTSAATTAVAQGVPMPNAQMIAPPNMPPPAPSPVYTAPLGRLPDNAPAPPPVAVIPVPTPSPEVPAEDASPSVLAQVQAWWQGLLGRVGLDLSAPSAAETRQMAATARDANTGMIRLESAAMQCALECQLTVDRRMNLCLKQASEEAIRAAGVDDLRNCVPESAQKYEACVASCGLPDTRPRPVPVRQPVMPERRGPHTAKPAAAAAAGGGQ